MLLHRKELREKISDVIIEMKLGISTNMFSLKRGETVAASYADELKAIAASGFDTADVSFCDADLHELISPDWERAIAAAAETAAGLGLPVVQTTAPFDPNTFVRGCAPDEEQKAHTRELIRRAVLASKTLGAERVIFRPLNDTINCEYDTSVELATNREYYAFAVELCLEQGMGAAFENTFCTSRYPIRRTYCENTEDLIELVDSYHDSRVGICWNFGHANFVLADQPRALRKVGSRLVATHLSDNRGERNTQLIPFVGGNVKWEKIIPCLRELGFDGSLIIDAPAYTKDFPDALRGEALRFALDAGRYLLAL